ncbi:MAG: S41 family peptidase [bacterium]|nr:S41 family peptidase [bacterium]
MNLKINKIYVIGIALAFSVFLLFPGAAAQDETPKPDNWQRQLKKYSEIYASIKNYYPEKIDPEKLFFASINGLLRKLDPHSYFLDPVMVRSLNEDQQGNYYGIGTRITKYEDRLTIIAPLPGTPSAKAGIMAGDIVARIEGKETRKLSLDDAMKLLRGAKGTYVSLGIKREGVGKLIPFKIKRAEIPLNSVSYSLVLPNAPRTGFISLRTFGGTTRKEVETSVKKLIKEHNIKSLILDLRGNTGGSLYAAIDVSDLFLKKDAVIVSVKGRVFNQSFKAKENNQYEDMPLAVLINRGSASASEIVASALQDNKKAVIVGTRSWGKGLVQTVSRLSMNSSLALTTAKYYTPANKSIQRDFNQRDDYYFFLSSKNYDSDQSIEGGVWPDVSVKSELYPELIIDFISKGTFFQFARQLVNGEPSITRNFKVDDSIMEEFMEFLKEKKISYPETEFQKQNNRIRIEIEREVMSTKFSPTEGLKVFLKSDPVTQKAVEVLKKQYH